MRRNARAAAFALLPRPLAFRAIRATLNIALPAPDSPLRFTIASTPADLKAALRLVQRNFERMGYATPVASGLRLTPYHLLPRTATVVVQDTRRASADETARVVATLTIIPRTPYGLPLESCYALGGFLAPEDRVVEISSLAVDPDYRGHHGEILYNVIKFMYHVNVDVFGAEREVIGINPSMATLYRAMMLFEPIPGLPVKSYDFVRGAPVVPLHFDLRTARTAYDRVYAGKPSPLNLMEFFLAPLPRQFDLPSADELPSRLPQSTPEGLRELLSWDPELLRSFRPRDWDALAAEYAFDPARVAVIHEARGRVQAP